MIRMQDVRSLFRYFTATPLSRSVALQFVLTNWKEINDRYSMCMKIDLLCHMPCKTFCNYHFGFRFGVDVFLLRDVIYATTSLINTEFEYSQVGLIMYAKCLGR